MFTKKKFIGLVFLLLITCSSTLLAGTTGKIAGKIIDKETGEALFGANVLIVGTNYGGAANIDGEYFIINVPPGDYEVKASMVGFTPMVVQNVRVSVDQTTKIDFELSEETIQISDVVVTARKPIVQKDLTSTESKVSGC